VPGSLSLWSITTTGHWIGYVSFTIRKADALRSRNDPGRADHR
jgi:hypothetical protein